MASCLRWGSACQGPPARRCPSPSGWSRRASAVSVESCAEGPRRRQGRGCRWPALCCCSSRQPARPCCACWAHPDVLPPPAAPCRPPPLPPGGLLSGALFQYPGAIIMTAVGVFAANLLANPTGVLNGVASGGGCWMCVWGVCVRGRPSLRRSCLPRHSCEVAALVLLARSSAHPRTRVSPCGCRHRPARLLLG
jgi:hypothetical protein